ncbi:sensor histidine kinase [Paenibacillus sp. JX-17]|uniref:histidine kinase n=1 Tax=Paenibacillus lacisoli TaxID=3064525 RepID=A0ABT9C6F2_9BACL|nr:sensor histidine kinase [Paenibacillus sp. JX-17]MDO7904836.1 sensor histidine kinase [Paenibacillus sp. JX-17]
MNKWQDIFRRNTGMNLYVWLVCFILPFYFIIGSFSKGHVVFGVLVVIIFFSSNLLSLIFKGWQTYLWYGVQISISALMGVLFGFVYFSLFLAFFIGNIQNKAGFITLYTVHLVSTLGMIYYSLFTNNEVVITQLPFVLISLIAVILVPVNTHNKNKQDQLQGQLEHANKRISELVKLEERQRIARDLHDTLGQKLSLIGLKSELAGKLITRNPRQAQEEMRDVRQTARTALKEVREMVTQMRGTRLEDELFRVEQILKAADIESVIVWEHEPSDISLMTENVLSMCLKEAVTNVVKHSEATICNISIRPSRTELVLRVKDNGIGIHLQQGTYHGNGLRGMRERLEFINGSMSINSSQGTDLIIVVPNAVQRQV